MSAVQSKSGDFLSKNERAISCDGIIEIIDLFCDASGGEQRFVELYFMLDDQGKSSIARLGNLLGEHHLSARRLTDALSGFEAVPSKGGKGRSKKYASARICVDELVDRWKRGELPKILYANQLAALACEDARINVRLNRPAFSRQLSAA